MITHAHSDMMHKAKVPDTLRQRNHSGVPKHSDTSSQHWYSSSSAGIESREYKILQSLTPQLKNAIQHDLNDLCLHLHSCNLLTNDNYDDCTNLMIPNYQRASQLIRIIQDRVCEHPINYATFISVLENKPDGYYRSILSQLSDAMKNSDLYTSFNSSAQYVNQSESQTGAAGDNLNLHKYFWYFVIFTGINIVVNIVLRIFIPNTGMVIAASAAQFLLCFMCFFILTIGVILKDEETIKMAAFMYGLIAGIIIFVGISFAVVLFTDAIL